ncbi:hypothetical protein [Streptomyces sp. NBC_00390]|uniref:hypothetical protein n=1 Tax=Streptomyces sp. NBC_00390 TaxID=2975736 RepID=UPI003FCDE791
MTLPIACVEGRSKSARWTGVRVRDLLERAGAAPGTAVRVVSLSAAPQGAAAPCACRWVRRTLPKLSRLTGG